MQKAITAANLVERSGQDQGFFNSDLGRNIIKYGATALLFGGIGYLWYRKSSFRAFVELKDEEFYKLNFKVQNSVFLDDYVQTRMNFYKALIAYQKKAPGLGIDLLNPNTQTFLLQSSSKHLETKIFPLIQRVLSSSDYPSLKVGYFVKKAMILEAEVKKKRNQGLNLTQEETQFMDLKFLFGAFYSGLFLEAYITLNVGNQADALDHKECLQLYLDYEISSLHAYTDLYAKIVVEGRSRDLKVRAKEFNNLLEERVRMQPLIDYTVQKLGQRYAELPEDEKYHPMILFFKKALIAPLNRGYSNAELYALIREITLALQIQIHMLFTEIVNPAVIEGFKTQCRNRFKNPAHQRVLRLSGLRLRLFQD